MTARKTISKREFFQNSVLPIGTASMNPMAGNPIAQVRNSAAVTTVTTAAADGAGRMGGQVGVEAGAENGSRVWMDLPKAPRS